MRLQSYPALRIPWSLTESAFVSHRLCHAVGWPTSFITSYAMCTKHAMVVWTVDAQVYMASLALIDSTDVYSSSVQVGRSLMIRLPT